MAPDRPASDEVGVPVEEVTAALDGMAADTTSTPDTTSTADPVSMPDLASTPGPAPRRLGRILVERGLLTEYQLQEALRDQERTGQRLGQILVSRGLISKQALGEALGSQRRTPYINLTTIPIDDALLHSVPLPLIREHRAVPFARVGREVHVAMVDPTDVVAIDRISALLGARVRPFLTTERDLDWLLSSRFDIAQAVGGDLAAAGVLDGEQPEQVAVAASDSPHDPPVVRLVDSLIQGAVRDGATDIHIEPRPDGALVRYRVDGLLQDKTRLPRGVGAAATTRIKALAGLDIAERVRPQDGRILYEIGGREHDLRIASVGSSFGERVTIRVLDKYRVLLGLDRLGLLPGQQAVLSRLLTRPYGMILVTGPTGSGKTTTLYAAIHRLNERHRNIMTIEDPVEYHLEGITQIAVRSRMAVTFATGLRAIIRQDPDVIMVGEVRDSETAQIAVQAALTGHLVLSTLHTNDAPGAVVRLIDMGVEPYLITSTLLAAVGQRLVRVLCPACRRPYEASEQERVELGLPNDQPAFLWAPTGCPDCGDQGYKGRTGVFEILRVTDPIRDLILQRRPASTLREAAQRAGMVALREAGVAKVRDGTTSLDELRRVVLTEND